VTAVRSRLGARRGGAGIALVLLAGLAGCSNGSGTAASPSPSSSAATASPTTGTTPTPTSTPSTASSSTTSTAPATKATSASAPVLPSRAGSPPIPWDTTTATVNAPQPTSVPSRTSGPAQLTVTLDDGTGVRSTWTLTCQPPGGDHPNPAKACGVLGANGEKAFRPTPPDVACSQVYGGPQKALVRGTWRGKAVNAQFDLENGCEVARWNLLLGLLPPGGLP
jgi:Subtilisin inhibitor-like